MGHEQRTVAACLIEGSNRTVRVPGQVETSQGISAECSDNSERSASWITASHDN